MAVKPHVTVDGRETPEQRQGPEPDQCCSSPSTALYLCFTLSVYVISLFFLLLLAFLFLCLLCFLLSVSFSFFQTSLLWPDGYCLWKNVLHRPRRYCGYSLKESISCIYKIEVRLNQWQSRELNLCVYFRFYYASNQFCFSENYLWESLKCYLMAFFISCPLMWSSLWTHTPLTGQLGSRSVNMLL